MFISSRFVRGIIFASICLFYSNYSLSFARERSRSSVISSSIAARFASSMLIRERIFSPIYRFFYRGHFFYSEYIDSVFGPYIGRYLIEKMIKGDPVAKKQVILFAINNIDELLESNVGISLIEMIIKIDSNAEIQIISHLNYYRLSESESGRALIEKIIEKYPDVRQQIILHLNFDKLSKSENGRALIERIIKKYPDAREQVILYIINHFDILIGLWSTSHSKKYFKDLFEKIVEKYPDVRQEAISFIIDRFNKLIRSKSGRNLIEKIIEKYPDARQQIIPCIINNIERLIESLNGKRLIENIIEKHPDVREKIISYIVNNFDRLFESANGRNLIKEIIKNDPDTRQQIISYIVNNFDRLIKSLDGRFLIGKIIEKYPDAREQIISFIVNNFDRLIISFYGKLLIKDIIEKYPDAREQIISFIVKNVGGLITSYWEVRYLIEELIKKYPSARAQILSSIKENYKKKKITKLPLIILYYLCEEFPHDEGLRNKLKKDSHEYGIEGVIKRILYLKSCPEKKNDRLKSSLPTVKHIERYRKIITELIERPAFSSNFLSMLDRVFRKEVELEKSGYVAFKHGQRWGYGLSEKWFTTLWAITKEKSVTDFIFLHVKPLLKDNNLAGEIEIRERLLRSGSGSDFDRQHLLFMNYALFGNTDYLGSSSVDYVAKNKNAGSINIPLKNVFNYLGYEDIYKKYEKQLQELEQKYKELSKHGSMVVIGVPEDRLANCVYLTTSGGPKKKIHIKGISETPIEGIGETDDIKAIITTLRNAPEKIKDSDQMEFALIMTQDKHGGLNPESGIKVHMFDAVDPEKLAAFKEKESLLLEQIKQEIRQEKSEESAATTAGQFIRSAL